MAESTIEKAKKKAMSVAKKFGGMTGNAVSAMKKRDAELKKQMDDLAKY